MNILYVPSWFISKKKPSNGIFFYEQAKALSKICTNLFVIYPEEIEAGKKIIKNENNIYFYGFPKIHYKKTYFFYFFLRYYVNKIIKKFGKIDLINAQSFLWAGVESSKIARKYNIPLVITEHHSRFLTGKENRKTIDLIRKAIEYSSKVVFVSSTLKESFSRYIVNNDINIASKFTVIPNSISDDFFNILDDNKKQTLDKKLLYYFNQNNYFIFSSIGNLKESKGFEIIIDAFYNAFYNPSYNNFNNNFHKDTIDSYMQSSHIQSYEKKEVKLFIGGDGPFKIKIEQQIKKLNLKDKVILLGQLDRSSVEYLLENSNCFVLASRFETFGIVYIEALAKGVPVIATNCGGPKDIINDQCGILTEVNDIEGIKNAMIMMYKNNNRYDKEKIRQYAFENFSSSAFINKYKNLYEELLYQQS
ncbi:MAG: glycosyltransferase [Exilispira sp.]